MAVTPVGRLRGASNVESNIVFSYSWQPRPPSLAPRRECTHGREYRPARPGQARL